MQIQKPYLLFLGDVTTEAVAKTAFGLRDWCRDDCIAQWSLPGCTIDLGLHKLEPAAAYAAGARSMVIAVSTFGGTLCERWVPSLVAAPDLSRVGRPEL